MKVLKKDLYLENGIKKEWLITNGLGGYSSSTVLGINTRRYHGLLVAPLSPPASRNLILSKLDESITINNNKYNLYSNMCINNISKGYEYQEEFEKEYIPVFTYKVQDVQIKKLICMKYRENTVCVLYKIENMGEQCLLTLAPIVNFRDFHSINTNHNFDVKQKEKDGKVELIIDNNSNTPIYMYSPLGNYIKYENNTFNNMYYEEEEKRGFYPEENHLVPGCYEINIPSNCSIEIPFVCSLKENIEETDVKKVINKEIIRINELMYQSNLIPEKQDVEKLSKEELETRNLIKDYIIAADNFVVYRPNFSLHTIIAGYPWFLDWGRDTLIAFEGILLITKRFNIAKEVLLTIIKDIKFGLVPNGYSGYDNRPLYNSSDSSLLLFDAVYKYLEYTNDYEFIKEKIYDSLVKVFESYQQRIDIDNNNIYLDIDYLISSGTATTQNTWMDAKYDNYPITPRNGKAVEINSLWYNALKILEQLSNKFGKKKIAKKALELAQKCKEEFNNKFYNAKKKSLYDVLGDSKVRPNQLFALSLTFPIIKPNSEVAKAVFGTVTKKLLNKYGLKTLAKGEKGYIDVYEGDMLRRDSSYHQGITWPWLLGLYYNSLKNIISSEKNKAVKKELELELEKFKRITQNTFTKEMEEEGLLRIYFRDLRLENIATSERSCCTSMECSRGL